MHEPRGPRLAALTCLHVCLFPSKDGTQKHRRVFRLVGPGVRCPLPLHAADGVQETAIILGRLAVCQPGRGLK